jgi:hypothetical protein
VRVAPSMNAPPHLPACQLRCLRGMHSELLKPNQPHNAVLCTLLDRPSVRWRSACARAAHGDYD